jgi:hypothetical protein
MQMQKKDDEKNKPNWPLFVLRLKRSLILTGTRTTNGRAFRWEYGMKKK